MSAITKNLLGFLYNGATVALAAAPWKNNVRAIYGFNAAGTGYQVFKPGNSFNSLSQLVQDGAYIADVATLGFELPGATLVASATSSPSGAASATPTGVSIAPGPRDGSYRLRFTLQASGTTDDTFLFFLVDDAYRAVAASSPIGIGASIDYIFNQPYGGPHTLIVVNNSGVVAHAAVQVG